MNRILKGYLVVPILFATTLGFAQKEEDKATSVDLTKPIDGVVEKKIIAEKPVLAYDPIREADLYWERKVWRVIDLREKMNLTFVNPESPFFEIIHKAGIKGEITVYDPSDDKFSKKIPKEEVQNIGVSTDTVSVFDPESFEEKITCVYNRINWENIKQIRLKESWFFDKETSTLKTRIIAMAPIIDEYDENGNFKFSRPLFWVYYPECRKVLARNQVYNLANNDASPITWDELFEQRFFSSYITKESNIYGRRLEDYVTGVDMLLEGEKIKNEIFHYEHDLWSY